MTDDSKNYYLKDFVHIAYDEQGMWKIDREIIDSLKVINQNPKLQTLYSKYARPEKSDYESYIEFSYFEDLEEDLLSVILPELQMELYYKCSGTCEIELHNPHDNGNYNPKRKLGQSATDNPNHFKINHIKLIFDSNSKTDHDCFWSELTRKLESL